MQSWNAVSLVLRGCLHKPSCPFFRRLPMLRMEGVVLYAKVRLQAFSAPPALSGWRRLCSPAPGPSRSSGSGRTTFSVMGPTDMAQWLKSSALYA